MNTRVRPQAECHPDRPHEAFGLCKLCYEQHRYNLNKDRATKRKREWAKNNPERVRAIRRKYMYGVTVEEVEDKVREQNGKCAICGEGKPLHVDHDHKTKAFRGMLCGSCNRAIGLFKDNPTLLKNAITYLEKN